MANLLTLRLDYYDGQLTLHYVSPQRMEGEYSRQTSKGMVHIPVTLLPHREVPATKAWTGPDLTGDWILHEAGAEGAEKNTLTTYSTAEDGYFRRQGCCHGNPGTGQRRYRPDARRGLDRCNHGQTHVHLSRFDGIHVLALDGQLQPNGSLDGEDRRSEIFSASLPPSAAPTQPPRTRMR